jgi:hypothetical protein
MTPSPSSCETSWRVTLIDCVEVSRCLRSLTAIDLAFRPLWLMLNCNHYVSVKKAFTMTKVVSFKLYLEVPIGLATLHESSSSSCHRAKHDLSV